MSTADLRSFDELAELSAALAAFEAAARDAMDEADAAARDELARLDERERDLRWEASRLEDSVHALDEDESGGDLLDQIEELNEEANELAESAGRVEEAYDDYAAGAGRLESLLEDRIAAGREFLARKLDQLHAYAALDPPGPASAEAPAVRTASASTGGAPPPGPGITSFRLPPAFSWVALDEVERVPLAPDDFRKVSERELRDGFALLAREVLPRLQGERPADAAVFEQVDAAQGRDPASGSRRVFEAFFGADRIRVERRTGDAHFSITNGRHRIDVARRLGLTHVPAERVEVGR